jgi:hypothetical protein
MEVKNNLLSCGIFKLQNREQIISWEDNWLGNTSLKNQYPTLYNLVIRKHDTVKKVMSSAPLNISSRRALRGNNLMNWHELVTKVVGVQLVDQPDMFLWFLKKMESSLFSRCIKRS